MTQEPKTGLAWVSLPSGDFAFGCDPPKAPCGKNDVESRPAHVDSFDLMQTEVTLAAYERCVDAGVCTAASTSAPECNAGKPERKNDPVNCVDFSQAEAFCKWVGGRLPSEQEWEFAAKSGGSAVYPWGDAEPDPSSAHYGARRTSRVGDHPAGATPWQLDDMAGNVNEWTTDDMKPGFKVVRGGSFGFPDPKRLQTSHRGGAPASMHAGNIGLRCAR